MKRLIKKPRLKLSWWNLPKPYIQYEGLILAYQKRRKLEGSPPDFIVFLINIREKLNCNIYSKCCLLH